MLTSANAIGAILVRALTKSRDIAEMRVRRLARCGICGPLVRGDDDAVRLLNDRSAASEPEAN